MKVGLVILVALAVSVVVGGQRQAPPQQAPSILPLATGTIQGRVIRTGNTEPVSDATVVATAVAAQSPDTPAPELRATTDSSGRFTIRNAPIGQYRVTAEREGFFGPNAGLRGGGASNTIARVTGQFDEEITIALAAGAVISGRVTDANRQPIIGAPVMILKVASQRGASALQQSEVKSTDDLGEYRHFDVPPGEYYVAVAPPRPLGRGARGASVPPMTVYYPDVTDLNSARRITVRGGEELTFIDIQVRQDTGFKISGTVTSTVPIGEGARGARGARGQRARGGLPTVQAILNLLPRNSTIRNAPSRSSANPVQLINGQPGTFEFLNVPPGVYDLFAQVPDPNGAGASTRSGQAAPAAAFGRTVVDVRSDIDNVSVTIHSGVDLTGHVTVDGAPTRTATEISIQPMDSAADLQPYRNVSQFRPGIEADGSFKFPVIPEGRFRFVITPGSLAPAQRGGNPRGLYVADVRNGGISVYDDGVTVGTSPITAIEIVLATNGGTVEGVTLGADSQPGRANVVLAPANRRQNPNLYRQAVTSAATGRYTFNNVPPGNYKVFAWDAPSIPFQDPNFISRFENRGISITVVAGDRVTAPSITRVPENEIGQ